MIDIPRELSDTYRLDLIAGLNAAPESEKALSAHFLDSLTRIEEILSEDLAIEVLAKELRSHRRAHGWSFLSGSNGEVATNSAHEFLSALEEQVIIIKGKNWYYSR